MCSSHPRYVTLRRVRDSVCGHALLSASLRPCFAPSSVRSFIAQHAACPTVPLARVLDRIRVMRVFATSSCAVRVCQAFAVCRVAVAAAIANPRRVVVREYGGTREWWCTGWRGPLIIYVRGRRGDRRTCAPSATHYL